MSEEKSIEKENAVEVAVEKSTVKKSEGSGNLMYLGPSLIGIIRHSTVFKDGIAAASKELGKEQSVLGTICTQVLKRFAGGK